LHAAPRMRTPAALVALAVLVLALAAPPRPTAAAAARPRAAHAHAKARKRMRTLLRKKGLASVPSVSGALAPTATARDAHRAADVVGQPPTLLAIPQGNVADLFWAPGVLDAIVAGSASAEQCGQFWSGMHDGDSGGMGACHMAENVGYSFGDILSGENSLCYMKSFPTPANLDAGAVTLVDGHFPNDDPTRLFSVPPGRHTRTVKVNANGQHDGDEVVFLRVHGAATNADAGNLYAVDLWFCPVGSSTPVGYDRIRISTGGEYTYDDARTETQGAHRSTVTGFVSFADGTLTWDTTRSRRAQTAFVRPDGSFKSDHEIEPDATIRSKTLAVYGGDTGRSYVVASIDGTTPDTLRFLAGAFKELHSQGNGVEFAGSTEFRTTYYAASPGSALEGRLGDVDLGSDAFYAAPADAPVDVAEFSCSAAADVEVTLDFTTPAAQAIQQQCEHRLWEQMQFCHEDPTVAAAEQHVATTCGGPQ